MQVVDPKLELKIKEAKKLIAKMARYKLQSTYTLEEKIYDVSSVQAWLRHLNRQRDCLKNLLIKERKKMDLLQQLVDKIRYADNNYQTKSIKECLLAREMNNHRQKLQCRMGHGSKSLRKEKQLLKDMKPSQQEAESVSISNDWRLDPMKQRLLWDHQMPVLNTTGDAVKDFILEVRDLLWRIQSCGVVLPNGYDSKNVIVTHNVKGKCILKDETWNLLESKVALQEQIKVAAEKIDELKKTKMALGLGDIIRQVERESEAMERGICSGRKKFPELNQREHTICSLRSKPRDLQSCSTRLATISSRYCFLGLSQFAINVSSDLA